MSSAEATLCAQLPRDAQKTLYSILSRVALPSEADEKYRTLKLDNAALQQRLLRHDGALELLALCRFELRGRTLVLPADASADAIHRALDAITAAAAPAASVPPAAPPAAPVATALTSPPPPRREGATAGASPEEIQARAEKRRRAAEADAAARALERRRWAADSAARRDRQAPAATPTRAAPTPPPPPTSDQRRFRVRLPAAAGAPARAVAVAVAHDATLDALREAIAAAGVEGAFALVRSLPHRVFDAELPGAQSLATLGLDDGLTLVAMPADARGRVVRGSVLAALGSAQGDAADVDDMDYEELLELQERIGTATDERAAAAAALESTTTFEVSEADVEARRAAGGDAARCVVCMEDIAVGDVLRRMAKCPHACHAPCLERWLATNPKCPVCGTV
ncbi:unnamed protein product [Pelagomonas calceolata]|uniref:RING-type E3 ubiquitin transferase n=1 Tax=Pelagomonas calceolata TaxID=35677 RepID=A0A8J2S714_9STRA|nr:unnamed protein product [Pelagomonas calceolata]